MTQEYHRTKSYYYGREHWIAILQHLAKDTCIVRGAEIGVVRALERRGLASLNRVGDHRGKTATITPAGRGWLTSYEAGNKPHWPVVWP